MTQSSIKSTLQQQPQSAPGKEPTAQLTPAGDDHKDGVVGTAHTRLLKELAVIEPAPRSSSKIPSYDDRDDLFFYGPYNTFFEQQDHVVSSMARLMHDEFEDGFKREVDPDNPVDFTFVEGMYKIRKALILDDDELLQEGESEIQELYIDFEVVAFVSKMKRGDLSDLIDKGSATVPPLQSTGSSSTPAPPHPQLSTPSTNTQAPGQIELDGMSIQHAHPERDMNSAHADPEGKAEERPQNLESKEPDAETTAEMDRLATVYVLQGREGFRADLVNKLQPRGAEVEDDDGDWEELDVMLADLAGNVATDLCRNELIDFFLSKLRAADVESMQEIMELDRWRPGSFVKNGTERRYKLDDRKWRFELKFKEMVQYVPKMLIHEYLGLLFKTESDAWDIKE